MIDKFKKNKNEWYLHSFGMILLAIVVALNGHTEISFVLLGISVVLMGIGALYNESKKQSEKLETIHSSQKIIIRLLNKVNDDRKYEYKKDGASVMLNKAELLNIFMKEEKAIG